MMRRLLVLTLVLLGLTAVWPKPSAAKPDTPTMINAAPVWGNFEDLSEAATGDSTRPYVQAAPNGTDITVVFTSQTGGDTARNPYFNTSTDNGDTWNGMQPIRTSGTPSSNVQFTYDSAGKRHAVWIETIDPGAALVYKRDDSAWGLDGTAVFTITENVVTPLLFSPQIVASGGSFLDIIWAQGDLANPSIYHARSKDNGSNWASSAITITLPTSGSPALAVDANGVLHAVWEEAVGGGLSVIYYAQGAPDSSDNITWSNVVRISDRAVPAITSAKQPDIATAGTTLYVSFADRVAEDDQRVYQLVCSAACATLANWTSANNPITTQSLGVKANDPFDISSTIVRSKNCTYVYYHGSIAGLGNDNEMVLGTNSCDNWAASPMDQVTVTNVRSIFPVMTAPDNGGQIYLVFEQVSESASSIVFTKNGVRVFLPVILKN